MIIHTTDSHQIPSHKVTNFEKLLKIQILTFCKKLNPRPWHLLKLIDKVYKCEIDPTKTVGATERTRDVGRTDGRTEWNQYTPAPNNFVVRGYNYGLFYRHVYTPLVTSTVVFHWFIKGVVGGIAYMSNCTHRFMGTQLLIHVLKSMLVWLKCVCKRGQVVSI